MIDLIKDKLGSDDVDVDGRLVTFINPWSYLVLRKEAGILDGFDLLYVDGISLVWLLRFFLGIHVERNSFDMTSIAGVILDICVERKLRVAFVGSTQENIEAATENILCRFPGLNLVCVNNGFFSSGVDLENFCIRLAKTDPDVIIAGMGTPKQEHFLSMMRMNGWKGSGFTCGGFFHQTAKKIDYYPKIFNALNLRWLYRIIDEPKLFERYSKQYSMFLMMYLWDCIRYWIDRVRHRGIESSKVQ